MGLQDHKSEVADWYGHAEKDCGLKGCVWAKPDLGRIQAQQDRFILSESTGLKADGDGLSSQDPWLLTSWIFWGKGRWAGLQT